MEIHRQPRESKRKRFKPWENLRRMFQRKNSTASDHQPVSKGQSSSTSRLSGVFGLAGSSRSRSTSELLTTEPQPIPVSASASHSRATVAASSLGAGLSVSHDSVFGLDVSPESDAYSAHNRHQTAGESLPSSASLQYMSELRAAIGGRHRSTEEDEGLPRSPVNSTPTTAQVLFVDCSIHNNAVHSGGGSDPSLLSINSCELDEAPFVSLHSRGQQQQQQAQPQQQPNKVLQRAGSNNNNNESITDGRLDVSDDGLFAATLNHSAARHKISIRPKRNHAPARPRQLPQLAEGGVEEDLASWTNPHPSGVEEYQQQQQHPSAPERKNRMGRLMRAEPVSGVSSYTVKQRSVSLNRTEDCIVREAPIQPSVSQADPSSPKPSAGSSSVKLARSKSSVEKKIQHEVAVFWRRTKEGKLFHKKESSATEKGEAAANADQEGSKAPVGAPEPEIKRKDLRKIKRDKEEKRKRSDASANKEDSSPPFLSRIFGSRRSSRRQQRKKTPTPEPTPQLLLQLPETIQRTTPSPVTEPLPVPKPRTVFHTRTTELDDDDDEEMEIDWRIPNAPLYNFAPPPSSPPATTTTTTASRSVPIQSPSRLVEKWAETDVFVRAPPVVASPKTSRAEEFLKSSPLLPARHHRIHIAGLSPYQRRVARIGNGLEISDDEWDQPEPAISPTRSYHFRPDGRERSDLSLNLENKSLPININQDFILKKAASPVQTPSTPLASENLRRSFEILKFSNEGLKKTIDSLNTKRMSQSSDQLHLSDGSAGQRESCGSVSNSTSSLNISDADDTADTNGSMSSLLQSADDEKDVRDDVLIVEDHKEPVQLQPPSPGWQTEYQPPDDDDQPELCTESEFMTASPSSHPDIPEPTPVQPHRKPPASPPYHVGDYETEIRSKPSPPPPEEPAKPKHKSWETRQLAQQPLDTPMFSMSVRVQNPPDIKFKRSLSQPSGDSSLAVFSAAAAEAAATPPVRKMSESFQPPPRPFIMSVRMGADNDGAAPAALPAQQLMAKLSARPWQSKEEKERQNKVALGRSQQELQQEPATAVESMKPEESESYAPSLCAEVKLRPKKPTSQEETSELLKVFARRSLKVRDSRDLTDVNNFSITVAEANNPEARNENLGGGGVSGGGSTSPGRPAVLDMTTQKDDIIIPPEVQSSPGEKTDLSKDKTKKLPKPPVAIRAMALAQDERPTEPVDRVLKSSGRPPPFFRPGFHEPNTDNSVPIGPRPSVPLFIRPPADDKSAADSTDKHSKSASPTTTTPSQSTEKGPEETNSDTNRIIESSTVSTHPDEVVWKKQQQQQTKVRPPGPVHKFAATKTIGEEVKAATAVPPVRQSKVLDMVHNFQRLQVT